jgi:AcrR family transcriptional regulator
MRVIRNDVTYEIFSEIYQRLNEPKAKRKAFAILEAAIACYALKGWERVTLEMIAREAGVSRALLLHYFKDAAELRLFAIKYIRLRFQKLAISALVGEKNPIEMIRAYVEACFTWVDKSRKHALVWLSFLHSASHNPKDRELNSAAVQTGTERIASLLVLGANQGVLREIEPAAAAKALQSLLMAGMICYASENFPDEGLEYRKCILNYCLKIAGAQAEMDQGPAHAT